MANETDVELAKINETMGKIVDVMRGHLAVTERRRLRKSFNQLERKRDRLEKLKRNGVT